MKNLFFVVNKEKIYAYIVSIMTIFAIFFMSNLISPKPNNTELTMSNSIENKTENENTIGEAAFTSTPYVDNNCSENNTTNNQ